MSNLSVCFDVSTCERAVACGPDNKCQCESGWSTDMDFLNFEQCATFVPAMYVLWALNVVLILFVMYKSTYIIVLRFDNFFEQRKLRRNYTLWHNKGLIAVILEFGISIPCQFVMAVLHFWRPTMRIGFDLLPTMLFFFAKLGFYSSIIFTQGPMLAATLKGDPTKNRIVRMGYISNTIAATLSIIIGALPFVTYTNYSGPGQEANQLAVMQAYYFCQALAMAMNALLAAMIIFKVKEAFKRVEGLVSADKNKNDSIRAKVNDLQFESIKQATLQGTIYILMGAVPFLHTRHAYFLPISWLAMPLLGMKLARQVNLDKKGAKTLMQRLGIKKTSTVGNTGTKGGSSLVDGVTATGNDKQVGSTSMLAPFSSVRKIQSSVISETTAMEELLSPDHPSHMQFIQFVKARHATSELELLEQLLAYRKAKTSKERKKLGTNIMKKYIVDGSPQQVDIPDQVKRTLMSTAAKGMFVEGTFDAVRGPLVFDIKGNFFAPFEKKMSMNTFSEENF